MNNFRGRSYLSENIDDLQHPAAPLLRDWRDNGVPAQTSSATWTSEQRDECVRRGCHHSANEHSDFLREEMAEFIENKFWMVLPYDQVRDLPNLQLSPAAVKDERDRKPRLLSDHSWPWGWDPINVTTLPHAPPEAMQFGRALHRILYRIRHANPRYGPVLASKHDIKDGFYRMFLNATDCPRLALVLPQYEGEPQLVAIPMSSTMGWVQSPPTFSVMSETVCDLANQRSENLRLPEQEHRLEPLAAAMDDCDRTWTPRPREPEDTTANDKLHAAAGIANANDRLHEHLSPFSNSAFNRPLAFTDVYVDDFIQLVQGSRRRMKALRQQLLEAIDLVLSQPNLDEKHRNEAVSLKKLLKGDGSWATRKLILGWLIDTVRQTLELPAYRKEALAEIFTELAGKNRVSNKRWMEILGKLRFVSVAIPGTGSLFTALQGALTKANGNRIRITRQLRDHIQAFASLAASLSSRPTHLAEIIPQDPSFVGTTDAAKAGMGGVIFDALGHSYFWRYPFPPEVQQRLVSADNPHGDITNSDLEHAGVIAQAFLIGDMPNSTYATALTGCDNTSAVARSQKGTAPCDGSAAHLCHIASQHQREHRYCHQVSYLPGPVNTMADDASRLQHLTDSSLHHHFTQQYPQPQPWEQLHLTPEHASTLISALLSNSPASLSLPKPKRPKTRSSDTGSCSVRTMANALPSVTSLITKTSSPTCLSSPCGTDEKAKPVTLSGVMQWLRPCKPSGRGYPTWTATIPESKFLEAQSSIPYSKLSSKHSTMKTLRPHAPTLPTSPSSATSLTHSTPNTPSKARLNAMSLTSSSLPSSGSSVLQNISNLPTRKPDLRPSSSNTSTSPSEVLSTTHPRHL